MLLFVAPPVYAGADYFIFGRILYYLPYLSPLHPGRVWSTFIGLDIVVEILAANGASRVSNSQNTPSAIKTGLNLVKASLLLQIGLFCGFVLLIIIFHYRCIRAGHFTRKIKIIVYELYASSCFILLRNTFRTATFWYSYNAYANRMEWPFWVFEVLPMVSNTFLLNVWPPAKYMPANHKIYLAKDGKTEVEGPGKLDHRPYILTVIDPFDLFGILTGRDKKNRYWEEDGIGGPMKMTSASAA